jgi:hypothetical protein
VCGADGHSYTNACWAACAQTDVVHQGPCSRGELLLLRNFSDLFSYPLLSLCPLFFFVFSLVCSSCPLLAALRILSFLLYCLHICSSYLRIRSSCLLLLLLCASSCLLLPAFRILLHLPSVSSLTCFSHFLLSAFPYLLLSSLICSSYLF